MADSRLRRKSLTQSKKQLYISIFGIIAVLFIALNFGPTLIGGLGGLIDTITGKNTSEKVINSNADIQAPTLDPIPVATPSAHIDITGESDYPDAKVELYVNDFKAGETDVDDSQIFSFEGVKLSKGDNTIKARLIVKDKKSDFSEELKISYANEAPKLEVISPSDHQSFTKADQQINVTGKTDSQNTVSVNDFVAIVDNNGNFSYHLNLSDGDNKIKITASAPSGQTTTTELTVSYTP